MPRPPKVDSAAAQKAKTTSLKNAQAVLVDATHGLGLSATEGLCKNAAMHGDLPAFIAALADAMTKDATRIEAARLKQAAKQAGIPFPSATAASVDTSPGRGVAKMQMDSLALCRWIKDRQNLLISGDTQTGKSHLASVLARAALEKGFTVLYRNTTDLLREWFEVCEHKEAFARVRAQTKEADLLVLDNFGEGNPHAHDLGFLREIITERFDEEGNSICIVSSCDANGWREWMNDRDESRAIAERITNAYIKVTLLRGPK